MTVAPSRARLYELAEKHPIVNEVRAFLASRGPAFARLRRNEELWAIHKILDDLLSPKLNIEVSDAIGNGIPVVSIQLNGEQSDGLSWGYNARLIIWPYRPTGELLPILMCFYDGYTARAANDVASGESALNGLGLQFWSNLEQLSQATGIVLEKDNFGNLDALGFDLPSITLQDFAAENRAQDAVYYEQLTIGQRPYLVTHIVDYQTRVKVVLTEASFESSRNLFLSRGYELAASTDPPILPLSLLEFINGSRGSMGMWYFPRERFIFIGSAD